MAVLKMYKEFKYWDIIEEIYSNDKIQEASSHYTTKGCVGVPDIIHIIREYPENIKRTYCKCGYTSGNINHESCPKCGNKNLLMFHQLNNYNSLLLAYNCEVVDGDPLLLKTTNYKIYPDKATNEFILEKRLTTVDFEIYEDYIKEHKTESCHNYDLKEIKKCYKYSQDFFDLYRNKTVVGFLKFVESKSMFPIVYKNFDKIPNLGNFICGIWEGLSDVERIKNLDELFFNVLKVPNKDLFPYIDKLYEKEDTWKYTRHSWRHGRPTSPSHKVELSFFDNYHKFLTNEMRKTVDYLIIHGQFTASNIKDMMEEVINLKLDKENELLISHYIRNNYITNGSSVIREYSKDVKFLNDNGYSVTIANLDKRALNILKNLIYMEDRGYNPKKATFFLDMFELNPLDSLQYLDNKRAPNKLLIEELRNKLD